MKKMTKRIALALSMVLFALAFTACGPNLLSGGDGGSKDTEGGIGDTLSNMFFDYTVLEATSPAEYDGYTAAEGNRLIVCSVKVKNTFGETIPMYDSDFQLQWGNIGGSSEVVVVFGGMYSVEVIVPVFFGVVLVFTKRVFANIIITMATTSTVSSIAIIPFTVGVSQVEPSCC